jgi:hypothetical protein
VIELVRGLLLARLRMPGDYSESPVEAVTMFCGRYLEILLYEASVQMCRVSLAETRRFPEGAAQHFEVMFTEVQARLSAYLAKTFSLSARASADASQRLLGQLLYPRFPRALFGIDKLATRLSADTGPPDIDLQPIRKAVAELIGALPRR